eukprot:3192785-Alexandrium_andersonii.AAC.1
MSSPGRPRSRHAQGSHRQSPQLRYHERRSQNPATQICLLTKERLDPGPSELDSGANELVSPMSAKRARG